MRAKFFRIYFRRSSTVGHGSLLCMVLFGMIAGCSQTMPDRAERMTRGYVYYLDGAGGGGTFTNWSGGLKEGMLDAGYNGAGEIFPWNTGLGVVADQNSSVEYKKGKASDCAQRIQQYAREQPGAPVTLIGLSAGTAVTVFTLEALPVNCPVENVILCGASISADYDLTRALQRVKNRMYVFTSEKDGVLAFLVPMAGTADRESGDVPSAGLRGFQTPRGASAETRAQYAKVTHIHWRPEFERYGDFGGHTDALKAPFVQQYMAPLIMASMARRTQAVSTEGKVPNPDYERWAKLKVGASTTFEGYQVAGGGKQQLRMTAKLISKHEDRLIVERTYVPVGGGQKEPIRVQQFLVDALINPAEHPFTSPTAKISELPAETITIGGKALKCRVRSVQAAGDFPEYGRGVSATLWQNDSLPGGMAKVWLKSSKGDQPFEFRGEVVEYGVR
jgi:pimeloyl-ACP methyl ester carboxylesterase